MHENAVRFPNFTRAQGAILTSLDHSNSPQLEVDPVARRSERSEETKKHRTLINRRIYQDTDKLILQYKSSRIYADAVPSLPDPALLSRLVPSDLTERLSRPISSNGSCLTMSPSKVERRSCEIEVALERTELGFLC